MQTVKYQLARWKHCVCNHAAIHPVHNHHHHSNSWNNFVTLILKWHHKATHTHKQPLSLIINHCRQEHAWFHTSSSEPLTAIWRGRNTSSSWKQKTVCTQNSLALHFCSWSLGAHNSRMQPTCEPSLPKCESDVAPENSMTQWWRMASSRRKASFKKTNWRAIVTLPHNTTIGCQGSCRVCACHYNFQTALLLLLKMHYVFLTVSYHEHVAGDWVGQVGDGGGAIVSTSTLVGGLTSGAAAWFVTWSPGVKGIKAETHINIFLCSRGYNPLCCNQVQNAVDPPTPRYPDKSLVFLNVLENSWNM